MPTGDAEVLERLPTRTSPAAARRNALRAESAQAPKDLDLLPVVTYAPPIAAPGTPPGPMADLFRLNTGVPATPEGSINRLGVLGGDRAGFPNGRRLQAT